MTEAAEVERRAADWIARKDGERWSDDLQRELDAWLDASIFHRVAFLRLKTAWDGAGRLAALGARNEIGRAAAARPGLRWGAWKIAAGVMLCIGVLASGGAWYVESQGQTYAAAIGRREVATLADGSRITLNTNTRLKARMDADQRQVWLERGEAFFEVAHDAAHPFVVHVDGQDITVLGTKFSVRADADRVLVSVVEGRVRLEPARRAPDAAPTVLTRNEAAVSTIGNVLVSRKSDVELRDTLSWRQGRLVFDQTTLEQAATEFNRYNRKQLVVADHAAASLLIGGSFDVDNVEGFARLLHEGFGLVVQVQGDLIRVSS